MLDDLFGPLGGKRDGAWRRIRPDHDNARQIFLRL